MASSSGQGWRKCASACRTSWRGDNGLSGLAREILDDCYQQVLTLDQQVAAYGEKILRLHRSSLITQTLGVVPGIGPITATALLASLCDGKAFATAR